MSRKAAREERKKQKEMMGVIAEIMSEDIREVLDKHPTEVEKKIIDVEGLSDGEVREALGKHPTEEELNEIALKKIINVEGLSDDEVREKAIECAIKCDEIEFTPYIDKIIQQQFYCKFEGFVNVCEESEKKGEGRRIYYTKWYKKGGRLHYIGWLTVGMIRKLMMRSLKMGSDLIMETIEDVDKEGVKGR